MADTSIEWTDCTWNPVVGCTMVSPGCSNCYAMRMAARLERMGVSKYNATTRKSAGRSVWTGRIHMDERTLLAPLEWRSSRRVFVNSMSDLFHEDVTVEFIARVWGVMSVANWHTFQILTKRPDRMLKILGSGDFALLPNVWLGTSVESRDFLERVNLLREVPGAVRFLSCEPLLGSLGALNLDRIDWVIVGGESGPGSRPIEIEWIDQIRLECQSAGVPFFFKQWGGTNKRKAGRLLMGQLWEEFPKGQAAAA